MIKKTLANKLNRAKNFGKNFAENLRDYTEIVKENLGKKIAPYLFAGGLGVLGMAYAKNADAQALDNSGGGVQGTFKEENSFNAYNVSFLLRKLPDESGKKSNKELLRAYPGLASITSIKKDKTNPEINAVIPIFSYETKRSDEFNAAYFKPNKEEKKIFDDFLEKKSEGGAGNITPISKEEAGTLFHILHEKNSDPQIYLPISLKADTTHLDSAFHKGTNAGIVIPSDGEAILFRKFDTNRETVYAVGHPCGLSFLVLNESETKVSQEEFQEYKTHLDSLGRDFLASEKVKENYESRTLFNGKALDLTNLPYLEKKESCEEPGPGPEPKSNINGRLKLGAGVTIPKGVVAEISPQIQLDKEGKYFVGPSFEVLNSEKSLENITQEDPIRQVASVPAQLFYVNTGLEVKENTKVTNNFRLGLNFSAKVYENLEAFFKAGLVGQKIEKTMTSKGKEYMEDQGAETDVKLVDETNTFITNNSPFKKSPVSYAGAGLEFLPFSKKANALKNTSVYVEGGYIFGNTAKTSGPLVSFGAKYNLRKTQNKSKQ